MRNARRLALLLVAVTLATTAHLVSSQPGASDDRAGRVPVTRNVVTQRDHSAVVPLSGLTRAGHSFGNPVDAALAFACVLAAVAAGWLLLAARLRDRVTLLLVAFRRRGPPLLPAVT